MAGLQLGPDALNLAGARHGACRIARKVRRELGGEHSDAGRAAGLTAGDGNGDNDFDSAVRGNGTVNVPISYSKQGGEGSA